MMPTAAIILLFASGAALPGSHAFFEDVPVRELAGADISTGIFEVPPEASQQAHLKRVIVFGPGSPPAVQGSDAEVYRAGSSNGFFSVMLVPRDSIPLLQNRGHHVIEDFLLDFDAQDASRIGQITRAQDARDDSEYSGRGVTVAIVDTGVDFSNPDIRDSLARDSKNHPIMLDADGQGIVITNATFYAHIDGHGKIRNYTLPAPDNATSKVYRTSEGVFLDIEQGGGGTVVQVYNSFFPLAGSEPVFNGTLTDDMRIGRSYDDYIASKSGIYHLGLMYQGALSGAYPRIQVVPVLVTDPNIAGLYDTITPDLTTSWEDYTRHEESGQPDYDFDFTDERSIVLGSGNEFLVYDSDGDGRDDYSAGAIGARVLDVYGIMTNRTATVDDDALAVNGTLLQPLDPGGNYLGVMTDFQGHGTSSAATIASRGDMEYDIYNDTGKYRIAGVAPDAKILPIKSLWFGDVVYSWLWAAGFDNDDVQWRFTGEPRAQVISNSWGVSHFPTVGSAPGLDVVSLILGVLSTPGSLDDDFPGVSMVVSAGNSGPGYGTMAMPNSSPFGISVGATTNNVFVGYGPFKGQPRFGNTTDHHGHVADFSSRGPGIIGDPKPDLMSIGAHGFVPSSVLRLEKDSASEPFTMFGGTSMAAPLVSGGAAILMQGLTENGIDYDPFLIKNILMSSATDLQNDAFTQGSGLLNVHNAIKYAEGRDVFLVYNDASFENIRSILAAPLEGLNSTALNLQQVSLPEKSFPMTSWFAGILHPGERATAGFTVQNPTDEEMLVSVGTRTLEMVQQTSYSGHTKPRLQDRILNDSAYRPNYIPLSDIKNYTDLGSFYTDGVQIPPDSDLMILNLNFPFGEFMNKTHDIYAEDLKISSLYVYDWTDRNNNTQVTSDELSMVTRGGSWGTVQELRVSEPAERFEGTPMVGVYPVPTKFSFWVGDTQNNATAMNYKLTSTFYGGTAWDPVWIGRDAVSVPPGGSEGLDVTIVVPPDAQTGVYSGFLTFESDRHSVSVPASYVVAEPVPGESSARVGGVSGRDVLHGTGYVKGAFDMANRYMAGDWRQYYFDIQSPDINSASVEFSWENPDTNLAVFAVGPGGDILQTNVPSGVFGHFMSWPSLDWLGTSPFSQGGGFFPVKNKDDTSTVLHVPINRTGIHAFMVHSTLFAGNHTSEPISMLARFSNIGIHNPPPVIELDMPGIVLPQTPVRPRISDDDLEGVRFLANSTELFVAGDRLDIGGLPDGSYTLNITAWDSGGGRSTEYFQLVKDHAAVGPEAAGGAVPGIRMPDTGPPDVLMIAIPVAAAAGTAVAVFVRLGGSVEKQDRGVVGI